jgi:ectoine hydroxylase-related dioxygenase (phytanoyl-CoA dioxygenase family)
VEGEDWKNTINYKTIKELKTIVLNNDLITTALCITGAKSLTPLFVQTSWTPTTGELHKDLFDYKVAAWIALESISENSAPFEAIPTSHKSTLAADRFIFLAGCGDVLFWHPKLIHRANTDKYTNIPRKCIICHYV